MLLSPPVMDGSVEESVIDSTAAQAQHYQVADSFACARQLLAAFILEWRRLVAEGSLVSMLMVPSHDVHPRLCHSLHMAARTCSVGGCGGTHLRADLRGGTAGAYTVATRMHVAAREADRAAGAVVVIERTFGVLRRPCRCTSSPRPTSSASTAACILCSWPSSSSSCSSDASLTDSDAAEPQLTGCGEAGPAAWRPDDAMSL